MVSFQRHICHDVPLRRLSRSWAGTFTLIVVSVLCAQGADFSSPLSDVTVSMSGHSTVVYQVNDPFRGLATGSADTPGVASTPQAVGGVVAWVANKVVYLRIYDILQGAWKGTSVNRQDAAFVSEPVNNQGVVAWRADAAAYCAVYDPARGWRVEGFQTSANIGTVQSVGGVAAFVSGAASVYYLTYDPVAGVWRGGSVMGPSAPSVNDLTVAGGVVAWSVNTVVRCRVYDFPRGLWKDADVPVAAGYVPDLRISVGTVQWTDGTTPQTRGYHRTNAAWYAGPTLPYANFHAYPMTNNAPLTNWYSDLSLGANSRAWNFGDGSTSTSRTPYHLFHGFARFTNTFTVTGPAGSDATNRFITTDVAAPSGTVVVNGGLAYTRSTNVTLALAASDNSGTVAAMRFSNTGSAWSAWEPFAASKAWGLLPGAGLRTVYAQFKDAAENVSANATDTITVDTNPLPIVSFSTANFVVQETNASITITVQLSAATVFTAAVNYATSDGTASAGLDYAPASGRLTFLPLETTKTFSLWITNDALPEPNETILLTLSNPTNCLVGEPSQVTLMDNDPPTLAFAASAFSAAEGLGEAVIAVLLNAASGRTVTVEYATRNGTALAGVDYQSVSNRLIFLPGQTLRTFAIPILDDTRDEPDETVWLDLFSPTNALLGALSNAVLTLLDDDPPTVSFASAIFATNESAGSAVLTVHLSSAFDQTVYADYVTLNGTALAGSDYFATSGTLIFPPGTTNKTFPVNLIPDAISEPIETVNLLLNNFVIGTPGPVTQAVLYIVDNASAPRLLAPARLPDGSFQFSLLGPAGRRYAIEGSTNLAAWTELARLTNSTLSSTFRDLTATNQTRRFYQARQVD
jgi:hypothetical protein